MLTLKRVIYLSLIIYLLNITLIFFGTIKFSYEAKRILSDQSLNSNIYADLLLNDIRNSFETDENMDINQYTDLITNVSKKFVSIKNSITKKGTLKFIIDNYNAVKINSFFFNKLIFNFPIEDKYLNIQFNFSYNLMFWRIESININ
tara:strand:+ start:1463 stop:1903 length:441 start_codon:yes stop_codon:yes gene_type:complete